MKTRMRRWERNKNLVNSMSFKHIVRITFVVFSLYLLGDAFYRWDGFRMHSTFIDFLPSIALAVILWNIVAILVSILVWLFLSALSWFSQGSTLKLSREHLFIYFTVFGVLSILAWQIKKFMWIDLQTTYFTKAAVFLFVCSISCFIVWGLRNRAMRLMQVIDERLTPLVWLFGMLLMLSVPLVTYHAWFKDADNKLMAQKFDRSSVSDKKRPNIILVTFDSLSTKNMSMYGYQRPTTPFIAEWAKEATLFTNIKASSNWTTSTVGSLMTGKRVWTHLAAHLRGGGVLKGDIESLPLVLKKNGYYNMALVANRHASVSLLGVEGAFDRVLPL